MENPAETTPMTKDLLRQLVAASMQLTLHEMPSDDEDLIDHGLHSVAVMQVVSECHRHGVELEFTDLVRVPTLDAWWRVLCAARRPAPA